MKAAQIIRKLEALSTKVWAEALRVEKLHDFVDDISDHPSDIEIKYDDEFERKNTARREAASKLRNLSFALNGIDGQLQELAWSIDRIVDDLEILVPPPTARKSYNSPDAWK